VLDVPGGSVERALAHRRGAEVAVVRQYEGPPGRALDVFPLGTCYAWNRGALVTTAPLLTFVDSQNGLELTVPRDAFLAARGFDHELGFGTVRSGPHDWELARRLGMKLPRPQVREAIAAARVARRTLDLRLAAHTVLRGGLPGLLGRSRWTAPADALEPLPTELAYSGPFEPLAAANPAKTHFSYRAGEDAVVHLHVNPPPRLRRSLAAREAIRRDAPEGTVPTLRAVAEGRDSLWVLEDLVPGEPLGPEASLPRLLDWAVELAGPPRAPLEASSHWLEHREEVLVAAPAHLRASLERALTAVGRLPARHMHGDLQPKNVLATDGRLVAIDWEGAWLEGIPGLDVVFLALFAVADAPDLLLLQRLAEGADLASGGLRLALARLGVTAPTVPAALLVMLSTWAVAEDRRRSRLGSQPSAPLFQPLLAELGPRLAARMA